jgi:multidrug efflux pump subunit AcrA (membrane-fusion protein)
MTPHATRPWLNYLLGVACVGALVAAFLVVGPASGSQATVTRTAVAAQGVVQSTVSGSGNLQAASQLDLGFKTSGTVTNIYVAQGQHVTEGQLLATLNPESAEVTLEQSKATLQSAEAALAKEEETDGETAAGGTSSGATGGSGANSASTSASAAAVASTPGATDSGTTADIADTAPAQTSPGAQPTTPGTSTAPTTSPATTTPATTPTSTTPATTPTSKSPSKKRTTTTSTTGEHATSANEREAQESKETKTSTSSSSSSISSATREANLASARAAVKSDRLTVQSDEEAVQNTKLYAPGDGTIVSLAGQVGETVSGGGTTKASSSSSSSSSGSGTGATATGGASAAGGTTAGSSSASKSSSSSSGSSSSSFAVLSDLSSMQLVVALSESEIGSVKAGQPATVTVEALSGAKLAAHVSEVALLSTGSSGAVSYDVTFQLDQLEAGLKVGMSATAEVVVKQAEGVNVPTSAISADSVTVKRAGKEVRQRVTTGLAGNTSTIVLSGLKAGETVVLPAASATSSSTNLLSKLGGRTGGGLGGGGIGGGGGAGIGGGGGGAFFRGGG